MHLSLITEPSRGVCKQCGKDKIGLRLHVFAKNVGAEGPFYCSDCVLEEDISSDVELTVPEVADEGKQKTFRAQKKRSTQQELEIAEELGGKVQKASGALAGSKGDIRKKGVVRVEAKYTEAASFRLELSDLHKILSECRGTERPVFVIDFVEKTTQRLNDRYAIVPFYDLKELLDAPDKDR